jgi:hypothetical protein
MREGAAKAVPDALVWGTTLLGDEARVRERLRLYRDVGIDTLLLHPVGNTPAEQLDTLGRALDLIRRECR